MQCTIEHLSGSKKGQIEQFDGDRITVGRNPTNTLKFDPMQDLDVSGDHAQLTVGDDGRFQLTDLGSKNGTFMNGQKVAGTLPIEPGSKIQFGKNGPEVRIMYQPGPKKAGATRMLLAQVQQDLEAQKQKAAESKKKTTIVLVVAVLLLAIGGAGAFFTIEHSKKKTAAETALQLAEEGLARAKKKKAESWAPDELAKADEAKSLAETAIAEGRWEDAKAAAEEAKKLYEEATEIADERARKHDLDALIAKAQEENQRLIDRLKAEAEAKERELDERIAKLQAEGGAAQEELERLRKQKSESAKAREIVTNNGASICLIVAETYVQATATAKPTVIATTEGTGFAISATRIATAKHVVQPWKFDPKLFAQVSKIKTEHQLDVKTRIEIYMQQDGKFTKIYDGAKHPVRLIPARDSWETAERKVTIPWNEVDTQVAVKPHVQGVDDLAAIEVDGASFTPVDVGPLTSAVKLDPVVTLGVSSVGSGDARKVTSGYTRTEVSETIEGAFTLTTAMPESYAGGPVFRVEDGKCVGIVAGIRDQTVTVVPAERAGLLKLSGSTAPGGAQPSDAGTGAADVANPGN